MPRLLLTLALAACLTPSAQGDWPHLRGPAYDGVSTESNLAESWPAEGPPQLWSRELGQGHSGFSVAEGKVFTQRQTLGGQYLLCLDPANGQTLWETRYDWAWQPKGAYPGPYATPTWYRGKIYYASPTGLVGCLDATTGTAVWSCNLRDAFHGKGWDFGYAATPLVESGLVILPVGGSGASLVALHADSGETVWATGSDPASYCPALAISIQGRRCVVGYLQNSMLIVDLLTGERLYHWPISSTYDEHSAWPLYRDPDLLLTSPFRVPATCLTLRPGPGGSLVSEPRWTSRELCNDIVSSVLYQEHVYGFDLRQLQSSLHRPSRGTFKCLEWATGKACWSTDRVGHAAVLVADGKLILLDDTGTLILARAESAAYHELCRVPLFEGETCWTPPTLAQGRLFVRSPSRAVCLYLGRADVMQATPGPAPTGRWLGAWRFDPSWLLSHERDYPNDAPSWLEMALWFGASVVLVFGGAALATEFVVLLGKWLSGWHSPRPLLYWTMAGCLGLLGPNLFSAMLGNLLFTWPASLYAAFHLAVAACIWAEQHSQRRRARWLARLAILGLLLVGLGYFELCKAAGMFIGWTFLAGLLPAFPLTCMAARAARNHRPWASGAWALGAFTIFFWTAQVLFLRATWNAE